MRTLTAGPVRLTIDPQAGGRISSWSVNGLELLEQRTDDNHPFGWGSYPMVPWAGRIRRGEFSFDGEEYTMPLTMAPHAIHGVGFDTEWTELIESEGWSVLGLRMDDLLPFGGTVTHHMELHVDRLIQQISVTAGDTAMPVTIGWHPWFRRNLERGGSLELSADVSQGQRFARDDEYIPDGRLEEVGPRPWDDCFVGIEKVRLTWPGALELTVEHDCEALVLYDPPHAICVEPQSGPPDAFNLTPEEVRLEPGETLERTVIWHWKIGSAR